MIKETEIETPYPAALNKDVMEMEGAWLLGSRLHTRLAIFSKLVFIVCERLWCMFKAFRESPEQSIKAKLLSLRGLSAPQGQLGGAYVRKRTP